jgi:Flp pilus assembly pilin Flp
VVSDQRNSRSKAVPGCEWMDVLKKGWGADSDGQTKDESGATSISDAMTVTVSAVVYYTLGCPLTVSSTLQKAWKQLMPHRC